MRRQRLWLVAAAAVWLATLPVAAPLIGTAASRPLGVMMLALGLAPLLLVATSALGGGRWGVALAAAGTVLAVAGLVLAADLRFLSLRLATIHWRIFVMSDHGLAPWGWVMTGAAMACAGWALAGRGSRARRGALMASVGLLVLTCGFFGLSAALAGWRALQMVPGMSPLSSLDLARAVALAAVGALLVAMAVRRSWVAWPIEAGAPAEAPATRRWAARGAVAALGALLVAGGVGAWHQWAPRIALGDVFADRRLATCVAGAVGAGGADAKVSRAALSEVRSLTCGSGGAQGGDEGADGGSGDDTSRVQSLAGIDSLRNLATLDLSDNDVRDLAPLSGLRSLNGLKLTHNQVADLEPLRGLPLQDVGLSGNAIRDVGPLASTPGIRYLGLAQNQIDDLTPLAALTRLTTLDVSGNAIGDVAPLAGLTELTRLTVSQNRVADPQPLGGLPALTMLDIAGNDVRDAARFTGFPALDELWIGGNPVQDVTPLTGLPALLGVDLEGVDPTPDGVETLREHGVRVGGLA
ncbi:leucine-rich repeat domain-containing protein [Cellulomonas chengniuliangii]|uniref:Leucine Rich repeat-containing protein n=1 Tax=Cellulomonas chengniuliangii TaxID=2968084 RepID=A0ABY5KV03_9CELL|nr:leucine-rich repeat domain-containing protein [Cellulomonas chengniuliangii]MCC2308904.1 hypothetical protein [Cellulomonas chengniuliangii]UUI74356.1 hypothetical protein NP064_11145 [Cellulomonas chengniuliangii]